MLYPVVVMYSGDFGTCCEAVSKMQDNKKSTVMNLIMEIHSCCNNIADMFTLNNIVLSFLKWPFSLTLRYSQSDQ